MCLSFYRRVVAALSNAGAPLGGTHGRSLWSSRGLPRRVDYSCLKHASPNPRAQQSNIPPNVSRCVWMTAESRAGSLPKRRAPRGVDRRQTRTRSENLHSRGTAAKVHRSTTWRLCCRRVSAAAFSQASLLLFRPRVQRFRHHTRERKDVSTVTSRCFTEDGSTVLHAATYRKQQGGRAGALGRGGDRSRSCLVV